MDQSLALQVDGLDAAGSVRIYEETGSGTRAERLANSADAAERALCYVGQSSKPATMSASASAMLRRTMIAAGLTEDCVVPKSVVKWRVQHTLNTAGFGPTLAILGKEDAAQIHYFLVGHSRSKPKRPPTTNTPKRPTFLE